MTPSVLMLTLNSQGVKMKILESLLLFLVTNITVSKGWVTEPQCEERGDQLYLWSVQEYPHSPKSWLYGTIHVPWTLINLPSQAIGSFVSADEVYFEIAGSVDHTDGFGDCLVGDVPDDLRRKYIQLVKRIAERSALEDEEAFSKEMERSHLLALFEYIETLILFKKYPETIEDPILDSALEYLAMRKNKTIGDVERPEDRCALFNLLPMETHLIVVEDTINRLEETLSDLEELIQKYNCLTLDEDHMAMDSKSLVVKDLTPTQSQKINDFNDWWIKEVLVNRNVNMTKKIVELLKDSVTTKFFAFGAAHFLGQNSVVDMLQRRGFLVKRIQRLSDEEKLMNLTTIGFESVLELLELLELHDDVNASASRSSNQFILLSMVMVVTNFLKKIK